MKDLYISSNLVTARRRNGRQFEGNYISSNNKSSTPYGNNLEIVGFDGQLLKVLYIPSGTTTGSTSGETLTTLISGYTYEDRYGNLHVTSGSTATGSTNGYGNLYTDGSIYSKKVIYSDIDFVIGGTSGTTSGIYGADGSSGTSGTSGTSGQNGQNGTSGVSLSVSGTPKNIIKINNTGNGFVGGSSQEDDNGNFFITSDLIIQGTAGMIAGVYGADGSSGTSGTSGTSGISGQNGTSGISVTVTGTPKNIIKIADSGTGFQGGSSQEDAYGNFFVTKDLIIQGTAGMIAGAYGADGSSGTSGVNGINGTSGVNGPSGTSGTSGSSGSSGINGTSGSSGVNGNNGTSGVNGANGANGTSGTSGTSGYNGNTGASGTSGTSGKNGTSGTSGYNGANGTSGLSPDMSQYLTNTTDYSGYPYRYIVRMTEANYQSLGTKDPNTLYITNL